MPSTPWTAAAVDLQRPGEPLTLAQPGVLAAQGHLLVGQGPRWPGVDPPGTVRWEVPVATPRGTNEVERLADLVGPALRLGDRSARAPSSRPWAVPTPSGAMLWSATWGGANAAWRRCRTGVRRRRQRPHHAWRVPTATWPGAASAAVTAAERRLAVGRGGGSATGGPGALPVRADGKRNCACPPTASAGGRRRRCCRAPPAGGHAQRRPVRLPAQ
jgi:hypothetical protein